MKFSNLLPSLSLSPAQLAKNFQQLHKRFDELYPGWSLSATRRKLIAGYWLKILERHFSVILSAGILITFLVTLFHPSGNILISLLPTSLIVFLILFFTMYWPIFHLEFLPQLDNCVQSYSYEKIQAIQECKKLQYHVLTLMLIHYCYQQMAGIKTGQINDSYTKLLTKQYGVSQKWIDAKLRIIILNQWDRTKERNRTEITVAFEQAQDYFQKMSSDKAIQLLEILQQKILNDNL